LSKPIDETNMNSTKHQNKLSSPLSCKAGKSKSVTEPSGKDMIQEISSESSDSYEAFGTYSNLGWDSIPLEEREQFFSGGG